MGSERAARLADWAAWKRGEMNGKVSDIQRKQTRCQRWGRDGGWPARRDRLPLRRRPCPDATLRCSRTNGKVFPGLPASWAPTTTPRVNFQPASPLPSPLFWPLPLLPQIPTSVTTPSPHSFAFLSPTLLANFPRLPSTSPSRLLA